MEDQIDQRRAHGGVDPGLLDTGRLWHRRARGRDRRRRQERARHRRRHRQRPRVRRERARGEAPGGRTACTDPIEFEISYVGPIMGCTDPLACNYNPLATVNDGSCKYYPDPTCQGPDLTIDQNLFASSMYLSIPGT